MTHTRQHGGWASQAARRDEQYLACTVCGQPKHPRPYRQPQPKPETVRDFIAAFAVLLMLLAAFVSLSLVGAAVVQA